jgi:hypothetical protein
MKVTTGQTLEQLYNDIRAEPKEKYHESRTEMLFDVYTRHRGQAST